MEKSPCQGIACDLCGNRHHDIPLAVTYDNQTSKNGFAYNKDQGRVVTWTSSSLVAPAAIQAPLPFKLQTCLFTDRYSSTERLLSFAHLINCDFPCDVPAEFVAELNKRL
jgi:hypothetical protein